MIIERQNDSYHIAREHTANGFPMAYAFSGCPSFTKEIISLLTGKKIGIAGLISILTIGIGKTFTAMTFLGWETF